MSARIPIWINVGSGNCRRGRSFSRPREIVWAWPIAQALIGAPAVLDGLGLLLRRYPHAAATAGDLAAYWPEAGGHDVPTSAIDPLIRPAPTPNTAHPN